MLQNSKRTNLTDDSNKHTVGIFNTITFEHKLIVYLGEESPIIFSFYEIKEHLFRLKR